MPVQRGRGHQQARQGRWHLQRRQVSSRASGEPQGGDRGHAGRVARRFQGIRRRWHVLSQRLQRQARQPVDWPAPAHGATLPARHRRRQGQVHHAMRNMGRFARRYAVLRHHGLKLNIRRNNLHHVGWLDTQAGICYDKDIGCLCVKQAKEGTKCIGRSNTGQSERDAFLGGERHLAIAFPRATEQSLTPGKARATSARMGAQIHVVFINGVSAQGKFIKRSLRGSNQLGCCPVFLQNFCYCFAIYFLL